ncbi:MAG: SpoIIE family protein phosphatase [Bacteroidetes bacterium]|nr:SpoIIE family protein phosphatase [Bacteroidota bacterium]MCH8523982.1 SpoIIE family protein phosphatase [Balneolales bacterium]
MTPRTILVVDDEPDLQMLMLQRFRQKVRAKEYEFLFAEDGQQALDTLQQHTEISMVLTDINMPRMDGLTLLQELQGLSRDDLKTVIVSAYGDMANVRTAMNRGAFDFVTKPIDFTDLETTITKTLREIEKFERTKDLESQLTALNTDLDMAARIQQQILRKEFPAYSSDERFDVYAHMIAAKYVGGDFYDFFKIDEDRFAFFIGDVAGKGMPAAIYMAVCDTMLKAIGSEVADPGEVLSKVNTMLIPVSDLTTFVTVFYAVLNLKTGELTYSNGGHNQPYLVTPGGEVTELENVGGLLMGKFSFATYDSKTIQLQPGDRIVTFTDGITEAEDEQQVQYEEERLMEFLAANPDKPVTNLVKSLFLEVLKFAGSAPQSDDITALAVAFGKKE